MDEQILTLPEQGAAAGIYLIAAHPNWRDSRVNRRLLESARSVLELLGHGAHEARQSAMRFRQHNLELFERMYPNYQDQAKIIAVVTQGRQQLEEQTAQQREQRAQRRPKGWDT